MCTKEVVAFLLIVIIIQIANWWASNSSKANLLLKLFFSLNVSSISGSCNFSIEFPSENTLFSYVSICPVDSASHQRFILVNIENIDY